MSMDIIESSLDGRALRIGIVQARFNDYAGEGLLDACVKELVKLGVVEEDITLIRVPGALEIPFALQQLASTEEYDALVAIGAVIRGETYHFEVVSNESASGIMQVSLDFDIPIANAVLTTENDEQTQARLLEKGTDAAKVAVEMANLRKEFMFEMDEE
ncbi:MAG: 6,7-dimethyl-8-ribityllumazine synthase [Burkholderiaceae bacterium]|nr:6,7-dimethyl-8-ribityllumazine synthase [Burkholderiaceae bacterium]MBR5458581.1 6,7-dimethyl-8-ribityllumazine synthase [Burkholderiaceae bacterium]